VKTLRRKQRSPRRALIVWGSWGPYHHARFAATRRLFAEQGWALEGLQLYSSSGIYPWAEQRVDGVHDLGLDPPEMTFRPLATLRGVVPLLVRRRPAVVFLPSYWHWSLLINVIARCVGAKTIMMNDTHAATSQQGRSRMAFKAFVVRRFSAALVAGTPQKAFFESFGLDPRRIFLGYDAVDNDHFSRGAEAARANDAETRHHRELPDRYILSLGRLVEKKNIGLLLDAFAAMTARLGDTTADLVVVGEGEELASLVQRCADLGLQVVDHHHTPAPRVAATRASSSVHFHPYASYVESPELMGLADAFVLASTSEEWGLVVNEAMASGTCVIVSDAVGCVPDLCLDDETAMVFPSGDVSGLSDALQRVWVDSEHRQRLAAAGRAHIGAWGVERFATGALAATLAAT
jgi:glycosyltransferase involved in cell wall biosynthesis